MMHTTTGSQTFVALWFACIPMASLHTSAISADGNHPQHHNAPLKDVPVAVTVNLQQSLNTITDHFIGHSLGYPHALQLSEHFGSQKLQTLARAITPLWARMGADDVTYTVDGKVHPGPEHKLNAHRWEIFNNFFRTVGWDLIFILAEKIHRNADGSWNTYNARQLLQFSSQKNYTIAGFELGNEYNEYKDPYKSLITPLQLAKDYLILQKLLGEFPQYYSSFLMGPDTFGVKSHYFHGFLAAGGHKAVRAATFHHYYLHGDGNISVQDFTSIKTLDSLNYHLNLAFEQTRSVNPLLPVWISETGSAGHHGAAGMSDRFVAGFLWLDKLGLASSRGVQAVIRHVFYGDNYGILDKDLNPNPDYWLTVLYKRVVRGAVFNATGRHDVRVYAACANTDNFKAGSLAVYMLNPNNYPVTFDLPQFTHQPRFRYTLTAGDHDGLASRYIALNGVKLQLVNDHQLPPLKPESAPRGVVTVPAYSYTFLVFPEARVSICLH